MNGLKSQLTLYKHPSKELAELKKVCESLAEKISAQTQPKIPMVSVDTAQFGGKTILSAVPDGERMLIKVELKDKAGTESFTYLPQKSADEGKGFLLSRKAPEAVSDIIKSLKKANKKALDTGN